MRQLSLYIVDDELSARNLLRNLLKEEHGILIAGEAGDVDDAFKGIESLRPDVVLLDVQMPKKDGFALIELLHDHKIGTEVIFVTAYEKYAIQAIRSAAFDYMLKPVKRDELLDTLNRLRKKIESRQENDRFSQLVAALGSRKKIKFRNRTGFTMIDPADILYCRADSNYSVLELESGRSMTVSMNLGKVEELLSPYQFCRISRSLIINVIYLVQVDRKEMICQIVNDTTHNLPISKKYLKQLESCCDISFRMK